MNTFFDQVLISALFDVSYQFTFLCPYLKSKKHFEVPIEVCVLTGSGVQVCVVLTVPCDTLCCCPLSVDRPPGGKRSGSGWCRVPRRRETVTPRLNETTKRTGGDGSAPVSTWSPLSVPSLRFLPTWHLLSWSPEDCVLC